MKANRSAKELLIAYLENISEPDKVIELFASDATIELPYLHTLGLSWRWHGKELYGFLQSMPEMFPGIKFRNVQILIETADQVFGEYDVSCIVALTGRPYHQSYMGRLVAENGKIKLIREALDNVVVERSMFRNKDGNNFEGKEKVESGL